MFYKITPYDDKTNIYKKYLGEEYDSNQDKKYSLIISNHVSWSVLYIAIKIHLLYIYKKI